MSKQLETIRAEWVRSGNVTRGLVAVAALVVIIAGLRMARPVVVLLLVAAFVALACLPAFNRLRRWRVPTVLAVLAVVLGLLLVVTGVGVFVASSLTDFVQTLPVYEARLERLTAEALDWLAARGVDVPDRTALLDTINPGTALGLAATLLNGLGEILTNGVLILITVVFILLETSSFRWKLRQAVGMPDATFPQVRAFMDGMKQYFVIKTLLSLLTGTLVAVWLSILGVDFPLLWGLLAFLLNYIPNIGSILAAIPATLLAIVQLGFGQALLVALGYLAINMVIGNFIEPRWLGHGMGLSPLVAFFSLIFWGWVLGPVGLLLSVPLTMTLKLALDSSPETRWLAVLLGPETPPEEPPTPQSPALEQVPAEEARVVA